MAQEKGSAKQKAGHSWTFLTNHAHVLILLARHSDMPMRQVASIVGITERAVQRIVADLAEAGYLVKKRDGRCNHYKVRQSLHLRHPIESHRRVSSLVTLIEEGNAA